MDDQEKAVITANREFYSAFDNADMAHMKKIWSEEGDISVIHPGRGPLRGRQEVISSWETILGGSEFTGISVAGEQVIVTGDMAFVICIEMLQQVELAATNIFARENGGWKMIHHQAGVLARETDNGSRLH